jgi:N-acetylglucosaminyldiphosphoundecaprenol N-acetyl-beta-D-mannosaminyltransferase
MNARTERTTFLGCPLDLAGPEDILAQAEAAAAGGGPRLRIEGLNVAKLVEAREGPALMTALQEAELVHADGKGIVLGLAMAGISVPHCAGIDLMHSLCERAAQRGIGVYLLGARPEIVAAAVERLTHGIPGLVVAGFRDGYFSPEEERDVADGIRTSGARFLFIGMSSPKKEIFLQRHWETLGVGVGMGVGGSLDVISGRLPRAPVWMRQAGFEWLFRLLLEPRRLGWRYLRTNAVYARLLLGLKLRRQRRADR